MAESDSIRVCGYCGNDFVRAFKRRPYKYCGPECSKAATRRREAARPGRWLGFAPKLLRPPCTIEGCSSPQTAKGWCSKHYERFRRHGDPLSTKRGRRVEKPCATCGGQMLLKPAKALQKQFCSLKCAVVARRVPDRMGRTCRWCGGAITRKIRASNDAGELCSNKCHFERIAKVSSERLALRAIGDRRRAKEVETEKERVAPFLDEIKALYRIAAYVERPSIIVGACDQCGSEVRKKRGTKDRFRCEPCAERLAKEARRRARRSPNARARKARDKALRRRRELADGELIDPIAVFNRDKWRCRVCGVHTPKRLRGTYEPNAPELDHAIPLAMGGAHSWANVHCACRHCNGDRGAMSMEDYLEAHRSRPSTPEEIVRRRAFEARVGWRGWGEMSKVSST